MNLYNKQIQLLPLYAIILYHDYLFILPSFAAFIPQFRNSLKLLCFIGLFALIVKNNLSSYMVLPLVRRSNLAAVCVLIRELSKGTDCSAQTILAAAFLWMDGITEENNPELQQRQKQLQEQRLFNFEDTPKFLIEKIQKVYRIVKENQMAKDISKLKPNFLSLFHDEYQSEVTKLLQKLQQGQTLKLAVQLKGQAYFKNSEPENLLFLKKLRGKEGQKIQAWINNLKQERQKKMVLLNYFQYIKELILLLKHQLTKRANWQLQQRQHDKQTNTVIGQLVSNAHQLQIISSLFKDLILIQNQQAPCSFKLKSVIISSVDTIMNKYFTEIKHFKFIFDESQDCLLSGSYHRLQYVIILLAQIALQILKHRYNSLDSNIFQLQLMLDKTRMDGCVLNFKLSWNKGSTIYSDYKRQLKLLQQKAMSLQEMSQMSAEALSICIIKSKLAQIKDFNFKIQLLQNASDNIVLEFNWMFKYAPQTLSLTKVTNNISHIDFTPKVGTRQNAQRVGLHVQPFPRVLTFDFRNQHIKNFNIMSWKQEIKLQQEKYGSMSLPNDVQRIIQKLVDHDLPIMKEKLLNQLSVSNLSRSHSPITKPVYYRKWIKGQKKSRVVNKPGLSQEIKQ